MSVGCRLQGGFPSPFFRTAVDAQSHPRKTRTCCWRNGNSRFVSHLDFRASETIPHPLSVLSASLPVLSHPIPQHSGSFSASYEPTNQLRRGFTRGNFPGDDKMWQCSRNKSHFGCTFPDAVALRPRTRIKIFRVEEYEIFGLSTTYIPVVTIYAIS